MTETATLLDAARARLGLTSDNKLAHALEWPRATVASYRCGRRAMDVEQVEDFAKKTGIPVELVLRAAVTDRKALRTKKKTEITNRLAA